MLDDREEAVAGDRAEHRRRWKAWLCWGNIIQFLDPTGAGQADGLALARTTLDGFDAALLAATAGPATGLLPALRAQTPGTGLHQPEPESEPDEAVLDASPDAVRAPGTSDAENRAAAADAPGASKAGRTSVEQNLWQLVLGELSTYGDPDVAEFAAHLSARGDVPAGRAGWDIDGVPRTVELAWPGHRLGIVLAEDAEDPEYMARCAAAGWHVRAPREWDADELARMLGEEGGTR